ncbi:MAG: helix-turn-helix transcriptional regulator [Gammaproteobacteria bacterium]|nr:helix-turn-helix transcriptional regulator [Gammaproteobacteria bacterium]MYB38319.1 helix-turn-helix transcriptional regulator [Gammaproteobacteria bacterium]MYE23662.1 helix-turn-helix transcriptional regulator [Gammaproteobacteria bacterium]
MVAPSKITQSPPAAVEEALAKLGRNIRTARLRRNITQQELAQRVGVSRFVVADVERGKPTTGVAAYVGALWALDLIGNLQNVAHPDLDEQGKTLEGLRGRRAARPTKQLSDDF